MTEIGRRAGTLVGTAVMAITIVVGVVSHGDIASVAIYGLIGGFIFGAGAAMIGNLVQGYIVASAVKEAERIAIEKQLAKKMASEQAKARQTKAQSATKAQ